jgi:hypothetical protein
MNNVIDVKVNVNNMPAHPVKGFVVARCVMGSLWYYGTYETEERANDVAFELENGVVMLVGC